MDGRLGIRFVAASDNYFFGARDGGDDLYD
jgi:hypothetical protein